jgi:hypothetical protein
VHLLWARKDLHVADSGILSFCQQSLLVFSGDLSARAGDGLRPPVRGATAAAAPGKAIRRREARSSVAPLHSRPWRGRQLQHGCALSRAQPSDQHNLAVGKLKRVVMHKRLVHIDLSETRQSLPDGPEPQAWH